MKLASLGMALGALFVTSANALPDLEQEGGIALYAAEDVASYRFELHYAGHSYWIERGRMVQGWSAPDCLVLYSYFIEPHPEETLRAFVERIEVTDGPGVLYPELGTPNVIEPRLVDGTFVYYLKDLSTYVTGVEVRAKEPGTTLRRLVAAAFGDDHRNLRLDFDRGCRVLTRPGR